MVLGWGSRRSWIFFSRKEGKREQSLLPSLLPLVLRNPFEYLGEHYYSLLLRPTPYYSPRETTVMLLRIKECISPCMDPSFEIFACGWLDHLSRFVSLSFWASLILISQRGNQWRRVETACVCSQSAWTGILACQPLLIILDVRILY